MNARHDTLMAAKRRSTRGSASTLLLAAIALALLGAVVGAFASWWLMDSRVDAAQLQAKSARETLQGEREMRKAVDENTEMVVKSLALEQEKNRDLETRLQLALQATPDCSLGPRVGRVLRDVVPEPRDTGAVARAEAGAAPPDPAVAGGAGDGAAGGDPVVEIDGRPVSCKAVAEWAVRNIGIAREDAVMHQGVIDQYERVRGAHGSR